MKHCFALCIALILLSCSARAQFDVHWIQSPYWGGGKAEFNIYDAKVVREGQPRDCEVIHILVREPFSGSELVKGNDANQPGVYNVLKLNQIFHVPTGLYVCQQMHSGFWRVDTGALVKASLTSNDSCGNSFKLIERDADHWRYRYFTYWEGMREGERTISAKPEAVFYDELPARVRMLDFSKPAGEISLKIAPTIIGSKDGPTEPRDATVRWKSTGEQIAVEVQYEGGLDTFSLAPKFPYLLREWKQADGSELHLRKTLKIDYWNYGKVGDLERAMQQAK